MTYLSLLVIIMFHCDFHPVIFLSEDYEIYDFSTGYDPDRDLRSAYGIGKYAEDRPGMYKGDHFEQEARTIHMGIDIAAPTHTPIYAFDDGEIFLFGINALPFDYGPTVITKHTLQNKTIYALFGHLTEDSLHDKKPGQKISKGEEIARVGTKSENGGWNPHLHFQLSYLKPITHDLPGVVSKSKLEWAKKVFPDPQLVLGTLYET